LDSVNAVRDGEVFGVVPAESVITGSEIVVILGQVFIGLEEYLDVIDFESESVEELFGRNGIKERKSSVGQ